MAPSARKVAILVEILGEGVVGPARRSTPRWVRRLAPTPSDARAHQPQEGAESCTCGSQAALVSWETPAAFTAHSPKFSVVVTEA